MAAEIETRHLHRAIKLALRGRGKVSPNPRVGAVVVGKDGEILGEGWHREFGAPHAEIEALSHVSDGKAQGGTLFVNLEPCSHQGKTPPCTEAIIRHRIGRIVAATGDPNPAVNGDGFRKLRSVGIQVEVGLLSDEARRLNRGYFSWMERGRAWCAAKIALSLDGKMADSTGQSKWISGDKSRRLAHLLRADHDAVLVGAGTVRNDNPELTVRLTRGPNPSRLVLAPHAGLASSSKLARTATEIRTILIVGEEWDDEVPEGVELLRLPLDEGQVRPVELLRRLPGMGICSVLVEGGATVLSAFLKAEVIDELSVAYAPSVIGHGIAPFDHFQPLSWNSRPRLRVTNVKRLGDDVVVTYQPEVSPSSLD